MIFHCDLNRDQLLTIGADQLANVFDELIRSHRLGFHVLTLGREAAECLLEVLELGRQNKATLRRIAQEITQSGRLHERASVYVHLTLGGEQRRFGSRIEVPLHRVDYRLCSAPTSVVLEDIAHDSKVYTLIFDVVKRSAGLPNWSANFINGGGDNIVSSFLIAVANSRLVVCLLDEDKKSPHHAPNLKSRRLRSHSAENILSAVVSPPCHEIENIIPLAIVNRLTGAHSTMWSRFCVEIEDAEDRLDIAGEDRFWLYFDIKEGLSTEKLSTMPDQTRVWLEGKVSLTDVGQPPWSHTGFGANVVEQLLESSRNISAFNAAIRAGSWRNIFENVFTNLIWWLAAPTANGL